MAESDVEASTPPVLEIGRKEQISVLLVDDEPGFLKGAKQIVEMEGPFQVDTALSAEEALERLRMESFDVVVSDYKMPGMNGLEFLKELRRKESSVPFIMLTGAGSEEVAVEAMKLGVEDYVVKDHVVSNQLVESIKELMLKSALPEEVDVQIVRGIIQLFYTSSKIELEVLSTLKSKPETKMLLQKIVQTLRLLSEEGIVETKPLRTVVACPYCDSLIPTLYLRCPECKSTQLVRGEALEHLGCGHVDFRSEFDKGEGKLVCPKCGEELNMLGVDYKKVEPWYRCSNGHFFGEPTFTFRCPDCGEGFTVDEAMMESLHEYKLTEDGWRLLRLGLIGSRMKEDETPENMVFIGN